MQLKFVDAPAASIPSVNQTHIYIQNSTKSW